MLNFEFEKNPLKSRGNKVVNLRMDVSTFWSYDMLDVKNGLYTYYTY